jgi:hypothetical protein
METDELKAKNMTYEILEPSKSILEACLQAHEMAYNVEIKLKIRTNEHRIKNVIAEALDIAEKESGIDDYDEFYFRVEYTSSELIEETEEIYYYITITITGYEN